MSNKVESSNGDEALLGQLAEKLGDEGLMKMPELACVRDGMPPGSTAVITPKSYLIEVAEGIVPETEMLHAQALDSLEELCGPRNEQSLNMRATFSENAAQHSDPAVLENTLAALITPTPEQAS